MPFDVNTLLSSELHSIKNRMQALLSAQSDLADMLKDQPEYQAPLKSIHRNSQQLNQQLVELLSILKIQHTAFTPNIDENWLCDTVASVIQELALGPDGPTINLDFDHEFNGYYDEQLISIAVHNALINAINAGANNVSIAVEEEDNGSFMLLISDDGPGFPDAMLDNRTFNPQGTGSGLGLYLMSQALEAHHKDDLKGSLTIRNRREGGAVVELLVP